MSRLLVCLLGSLRGSEQTWSTLIDRVLRPNAADLVLMLGVADGTTRRRTLLHKVAIRAWQIRDRSDESWGAYLDAIAWSTGAPNATAWRHDLGRIRVGSDSWMSPLFLGPWRWSATINLILRWELKQRLLADRALLDGYERFMITRSDQFFYCPPALGLLSGSLLWVPEGEDYGGLCDRLLLCSRVHVLEALSIIDGFVVTPSHYPAHLNPERFFRLRLEHMQLWPLVRRFRRVMLTVTARGDATRTRRPAMAPLTANSSLSAKYPRELALARAACAQMERSQARTRRRH